MERTSPTRFGIEVPRLKCEHQSMERRSHGEDYYCRSGFGKAGDGGAWRGSGGTDGRAQGTAARSVAGLGSQLVAMCDRAQARGSAVAQRLQTIFGVGPTTAAALVATVSAPQAFSHGRQFSAWLGLTPKQHSSGGKTRLGRITKRRRRLPAHAADPRRQEHLAGCPAQGAGTAAPIAAVDRRHVGSHRLPQNTGGDRQQARSHHLGNAGEGRRLRRAADDAEGGSSGNSVTEQQVQP